MRADSSRARRDGERIPILAGRTEASADATRLALGCQGRKEMSPGTARTSESFLNAAIFPFHLAKGGCGSSPGEEFIVLEL